jgi:peptide/nickel transport system permease protein
MTAKIGTWSWGTAFAAIPVLALTLSSVMAPWLSAYNPAEQNLMVTLLPPAWLPGGDWAHPLGTDALGRDYLSRLLYGGQVSIVVGLLVALVSGMIGTVLGVIGGFFGGRIDATVMFIITTRLSMPVVLVALAVVAMIGASLGTAIAVLGLLFWDRFAIISRAVTKQLSTSEFVLAARATGASNVTILIHELLPNLRRPFLAVASLEVSHAILVESALSFLGVGVQPPTASWGGMIAEGRDLVAFLPHLVVIPGLAIFVLVLSINMLGQRLEDDPRGGRE